MTTNTTPPTTPPAIAPTGTDEPGLEGGAEFDGVDDEVVVEVADDVEEVD